MNRKLTSVIVEAAVFVGLHIWASTFGILLGVWEVPGV